MTEQTAEVAQQETAEQVPEIPFQPVASTKESVQVKTTDATKFSIKNILKLLGLILLPIISIFAVLFAMNDILLPGIIGGDLSEISPKLAPIAGFFCVIQGKECENRDKGFRFPVCGPGIICKPAIYLYPTEEKEITVRLKYTGIFTKIEPEFNSSFGGWKVVAHPNGEIVNVADNKKYKYLFWEGEGPIKFDLSKGFIVEGKDTKEFLQDILNKIGLNSTECDDFISYWLPQVQTNKYNLIHFAESEYESEAVLDTIPKVDSMLRVFVVFKPLNEKMNIVPQEVKPFTRKGFTVIEWGGTLVN